MSCTPEATAQRILVNLKRQERQTGKPIRRAKITWEELREYAGRKKLHETTVDGIIDAFYALRWMLFWDDGAYYLMPFSALEEETCVLPMGNIADLTDEEQIAEVYEQMYPEN